MNDEYKVEIIDLDEFKVLHILSSPQRIEAKVIFNRDHISQKLIFTLMDITHNHGFGCSQPHFQGPESANMIFVVGTILPGRRSLKKYLAKLQDCLTEIKIFVEDFLKQLDFSILDISMFAGLDLTNFNPEHLAALRDQDYHGSWENLYQSLVEDNRKEEAAYVQSCMKFEHQNYKDIALVGYKLSYMLGLLDQLPETENEKN